MSMREATPNNPGDGLRQASTEVKTLPIVVAGLRGIVIGFFVGMVIVTLIRAISNECDPETIVVAGGKIFLPALVVLILIWVVSRSRPAKGYFLFPFFLGMACAAFLWFSVPTFKQLINRIYEPEIELIQKRADQFARFKEIIDDFPRELLPGKYLGELPPATSAKLDLVNLDFITGDYYKIANENWNALFVLKSSFDRLEVGVSPNSVTQVAYSGGPELQESTEHLTYKRESFVDDIALIAHDEFVFYRLEDAEKIVAQIKQLRYLVVAKVLEESRPKASADTFKSAFLDGQVFVFDLKEDKLAGAFSFGARNSKEITYFKSDDALDSAAATEKLSHDIRANAWIATWKRIHQVMKGTKSDYAELELPYGNTDFVIALSLSLQRKKTEKNKDAEVSIILNDEQKKEILVLFQEKGKIAAIKRVRELQPGLGLKVVKEYVEYLVEAGEIK